MVKHKFSVKSLVIYKIYFNVNTGFPEHWVQHGLSCVFSIEASYNGMDLTTFLLTRYSKVKLTFSLNM